MAQPPIQVCPICALDEVVTVQKVDDDWVMTCSSSDHPSFEWHPARQGRWTVTARLRTDGAV